MKYSIYKGKYIKKKILELVKILVIREDILLLKVN